MKYEDFRDSILTLEYAIDMWKRLEMSGDLKKDFIIEKMKKDTGVGVNCALCAYDSHYDDNCKICNKLLGLSLCGGDNFLYKKWCRANDSRRRKTIARQIIEVLELALDRELDRLIKKQFSCFNDQINRIETKIKTYLPYEFPCLKQREQNTYKGCTLYERYINRVPGNEKNPCENCWVAADVSNGDFDWITGSGKYSQ